MSEPTQGERAGVVAALLPQLREATPEALARAVWLRDSWTAPEAFSQALLGDQSGETGLRRKSTREAGLDLYHDFIGRHAESERPALRTWDRKLGLRSLSYAELETRARRRAGWLLAHGLAPGDPVCFVLPFGPEWMVCLAASLRLGLVASFLPPEGDLFLARRLGALKPKAVVSERLYAPLFATPLVHFIDLAPKSGPSGPSAGEPEQVFSHTYKAEEPAFLLFSPLREPTSKPIAVSSLAAYLYALRDGLLLYSLRPGTALAAPGFHIVQHQPALILAALAAGACYFHVEPEELVADPQLLARAEVVCLGIDAGLRDRLLSAPLPRAVTTRLALWLCNAAEPLEPAVWEQALRRSGLAEVPGQNLLVEAAHGGALAFSARVRGQRPFQLLPAPGCGFELTAPVVGHPPARTDVGTFLPSGYKKGSEWLVLAGSTDGFRATGPLRPRRDGRIYPADEVCAFIEELPGIYGAAVVAQPLHREPGRSRFTLLLFEEPANGRLRSTTHSDSDLSSLLIRALGRDSLPDDIVRYPLYPRRVEGAVDRAWCEFQYLTGALDRKSKRRSVRLLTTLRKLVREGAPTTPAPKPPAAAG